jgi:hypothetical protein
MNLRDRINAATDLAYEDHAVPEWGGVVVRVSKMSALDRIEWDEADAAIAGQKVSTLRYAAMFVSQCMKDPDTGDRVMGAEELLKRDHRPILRLFEVAARLNATEDANALNPKG